MLMSQSRQALPYSLSLYSHQSTNHTHLPLIRPHHQHYKAHTPSPVVWPCQGNTDSLTWKPVWEYPTVSLSCHLQYCSLFQVDSKSSSLSRLLPWLFMPGLPVRRNQLSSSKIPLLLIIHLFSSYLHWIVFLLLHLIKLPVYSSNSDIVIVSKPYHDSYIGCLNLLPSSLAQYITMQHNTSQWITMPGTFCHFKGCPNFFFFFSVHWNVRFL